MGVATSKLQWGYCSLLVILHGVTGGPATSHGLEIDPQFTGTPRGGEGGIHYSTVVKTTAGRPLTVGR